MFPLVDLVKLSRLFFPSLYHTFAAFNLLTKIFHISITQKIHIAEQDDPETLFNVKYAQRNKFFMKRQKISFFYSSLCCCYAHDTLSI